MKKYAKVINDNNKLCEVGEGTNIEFYKSINMSEQEVEQGYDGNWYLSGYAPIQPLDIIKAQKIQEINFARDKEEQSGFEYLGKVFDSDSISCLRISCAAQSISLAPTGTIITWTCQDNSTINLDKEKLAGLIIALANHSNQCHQKASVLKQAINTSTTKEEIAKINW